MSRLGFGPDGLGDSLYAYRERTGMWPVRATPGKTTLLIARVGYLESGRPIEFTHSHCRCDPYGFVAETRHEL